MLINNNKLNVFTSDFSLFIQIVTSGTGEFSLITNCVNSFVNLVLMLLLFKKKQQQQQHYSNK